MLASWQRFVVPRSERSPPHGSTMITPPTHEPHRFGALLRFGVALFALGSVAAACSNASDESGDTATDLTSIPLTTPEGGSTTLAAYAGTPTVVNFFASYCSPCRAEMPDLEIISKEFADEIDIVGVNRDIDESSWAAMVEETGVTFPTVFEGAAGTLFESIDGRFMPTTIFLDADGRLVHTVAGLQTEDSLRDLINSELRE